MIALSRATLELRQTTGRSTLSPGGDGGGGWGVRLLAARKFAISAKASYVRRKMSKTDDLRRLRERRAAVPKGEARLDHGEYLPPAEELTEEEAPVRGEARERKARVRRVPILPPGGTMAPGEFNPVNVREGPASLLNVRLKVGERAELVLAADKAGLPLSVWAREVLLKTARGK